MLPPVEREGCSFQRDTMMLRLAVRPKVASKGCGDGAGPQGRASPRFPQGPAVPGCGLLSLPLPAFPEEAEGPPPREYSQESDKPTKNAWQVK